MDKLGQKLVDKGLLSRRDLERAQAAARKAFKPLSSVLSEEGYLPEEDLLRTQAELYGMEFVDLRDVSVEEKAVKALSPKLVSHYGIMPVEFRGGVLVIAVSDPLDTAPSQDIQTNLGVKVDRVLARRNDIQEALRAHYGVGADTVERILSETDREEEDAAVEDSQDLEKMAEDASVVKLVNQLMLEAIKDRATDIHFEVEPQGLAVRRRIDGVLYETKVPENIRLLYPAIVSRIKLMSGLNIVERRLPQDGRAGVNIGHKRYDLRVSAVPAMRGEDIVVRILPATMTFELEQLGFSGEHRKLLEEMLSEAHGIIFVTGPTGSGKSTTLYACLSRLNTRERKIITIEEPVEYELAGITQTQVNPKIGLSFARSLRSMLRHDPDVMMVGEVRDAETARIAVQTAMTGHLVLSTLHTNDAAGGAVRLMDMGVEPYLIASTVKIFTAQRLVRVLCGCKESYRFEGKTLYRPKGCRKCRNSGYLGRVAISEFLPVRPEIRELILNKSSAADIRKKADELGMKSLRADGREKVEAGITTAEEIMRVTSGE
ncbi:MAG: GspE/PulE family protein [Kiritimatiellia bacterium]